MSLSEGHKENTQFWGVMHALDRINEEGRRLDDEWTQRFDGGWWSCFKWIFGSGSEANLTARGALLRVAKTLLDDVKDLKL
jgi:hypothetical protein